LLIIMLLSLSANPLCMDYYTSRETVQKRASAYTRRLALACSASIAGTSGRLIMRRKLLSILLLSLASAVSATAAVEFHRSEAMVRGNMPLSEAVRVGPLLLLSGQLGFAPGRGLVEGGIEAETRQTMDNIGAILARHGLGHEDLVQCLVMLADIDEWPAFNRIYAGYFSERFPVRSAFGGVELVAGARVEIECSAALRD